MRKKAQMGYTVTDTDKKKKQHRKKRTFSKKTMGVLFQLWVFIRVQIDSLIDCVFSWLYRSSRLYIPKCTNKLVLESATSLSRKIRDGEVKAEDVARAYIERIKEVNTALNAVVDSCFDEAIAEAKALDEDIASGKVDKNDFVKRPFLGIPFTTKDTTACKGLSSSFGLLARRNFKAKEDADVVVLMKKAGGIILGVTNVPQLNMWQETSNPVYGVTNNPYDTTRNVGGSSGGEASIIAACGSPIGIGTDIGGSIRIPAFMCGLFGHKPTCGLISTKGLTFRTGKEKETMVVAGPIARYAEDLIPLLKVLLGENAQKLKLDKKVDVGNLKIYYIEDPHDPYCSKIRDEMSCIFRRVVNHFGEKSENKPERVHFEGTRYGGKLWRYWMSQEGCNFKSDLLNREGEVSVFWEIVKFVIQTTEFTGAVIALLFNNYILPPVNEKWAKEQTKKLRDEVIETLGENAVLLYPSAPWPASYHYTAFFRPWNFNFFAIWNALKLPVTQVPLGLNKEGLPMGIQVVGAPYQDHLCIAVAKELEKEFGGYVPPFIINE